MSRSLSCRVVLALVLALFAFRPAAAASDPPAAKVDAVFADYAKPDSPGCALGVYKDGRIAYSRGYGMASLENGVPITPKTVFYIGSVSKQFTAFAVALLAKQGRISLDDDVRKYIPELPDYGAPITIRHLIHHTSGLREKWVLLQLAGWRDGDVVTLQDVLDLARRQKNLNIKPGDEHLYSNTGYDLLAVLVQRATGTSLREYAQEQIFGPLGMKDTTPSSMTTATGSSFARRAPTRRARGAASGSMCRTWTRSAAAVSTPRSKTWRCGTRASTPASSAARRSSIRSRPPDG